MLLVTTLLFGERVLRPDLVLCLLVFALTFPGRNNFRDKLLTAGTDIFSSWLALMCILALGAYATNSLQYFNRDVLLTWAIATPLLQWLAHGHRPHGTAPPGRTPGVAPLGHRRRRRSAGGEGGACAAGHSRTGAQFHGLVRRPHRRAAGP